MKIVRVSVVNVVPTLDLVSNYFQSFLFLHPSQTLHSQIRNFHSIDCCCKHPRYLSVKAFDRTITISVFKTVRFLIENRTFINLVLLSAVSYSVCQCVYLHSCLIFAAKAGILFLAERERELDIH